jgi:hypothetical protein
VKMGGAVDKTLLLQAIERNYSVLMSMK